MNEVLSAGRFLPSKSSTSAELSRLLALVSIMRQKHKDVGNLFGSYCCDILRSEDIQRVDVAHSHWIMMLKQHV
jgi:hypothetical protein